MSMYLLIGIVVFAAAVVLAAILADWLWDRLEPKPAELDEQNAKHQLRPHARIKVTRK